MSIRKVALEALKTKFEGIDEKVLSRIAAKIAKTAKDEEEAKDTVEEYTLQGIIDAYTDSRVTEGSETAIKTYEQKHGLKDGKRVKGDDDDDSDDDDDDSDDDDDDSADDKKGSKKTGKKGKKNDDDDMPSWARKLMDEVASMKAGKQADTRKSTLEKLLEKCSEKVQKQYLREFSRAQFKDDDDFNSWIEEITPDIEDAQEDSTASTSTSGKPKAGGGGSSGKVDPIVQARIDARKAETATPAIKGLPSNNE